MNTNTQTQEIAMHCLTYRLKGESKTVNLIASMQEIEQFIDDMTGLSTINRVNNSLQSFRPKALNPSLKPEKIVFSDPFIERQVFPVQTEINSTKYRMIKDPVKVKHSKTVPFNGVKNIVPPLVLNTETMCMCAQTGISFSVFLPSPIGTGFTLTHPFVHYSNVVEFISSYQKHGKDMGGLESQVLAGMLITVGRHKGYIQAKNSILANSNLQSCSNALLLRALNYFYHKGNNNGFYPILSLDNLSDPSFAILQHIKICEGEDTSLTIRTLSTAKKTLRARIYTDKNKQQFTQANADIKSAKHILEGLRKKFKEEVSAAVFENIETQLDGIIFVTEKRKKEICQFIWDVFNGDEGAKSIIILLRSIETDAVESDLLTMSMEKEIQEWKENKTEKMSLKELLAKQKDQS
jgi:hypothetical protein